MKFAKLWAIILSHNIHLAGHEISDEILSINGVSFQ